MAKTAGQFDKWMEKKRQRPIGICGECDSEKELRQREPEPLCGACLEKLRRAEIRENDPAASRKDARKREKRIRCEMNKVLNAVDALDGLIADEHLNLLSGIAKMYLKPMLEEPDGGGHGHDETARDRDIEPTADRPAEPSGVATAPSAANSSSRVGAARNRSERSTRALPLHGTRSESSPKHKAAVLKQRAARGHLPKLPEDKRVRRASTPASSKGRNA